MGFGEDELKKLLKSLDAEAQPLYRLVRDDSVATLNEQVGLRFQYVKPLS